MVFRRETLSRGIPVGLMLLSLAGAVACDGKKSAGGGPADQGEEPPAEGTAIATDPDETLSEESSESTEGDAPSEGPEDPRPDLKVVTGLAASAPEGSHIVGGGSCPAGHKSVGGFADCGGGPCKGNQLVCASYGIFSQLKPESLVVTAVTISAVGAHVIGGLPCAGGRQFMTMADCGAGGCSGNQIFCMKQTKVKDLGTGTVVTDLFLSGEGVHQPLAGCPAGFTLIGSTADCGGGVCAGFQAVCVKSQKP